MSPGGVIWGVLWLLRLRELYASLAFCASRTMFMAA